MRFSAVYNNLIQILQTNLFYNLLLEQLVLQSLSPSTAFLAIRVENVNKCDIYDGVFAWQMIFGNVKIVSPIFDTENDGASVMKAWKNSRYIRVYYTMLVL